MISTSRQSDAPRDVALGFFENVVAGRYAGLDGMATGNFRLNIEEPLRRFSMQFDGGAERTTTLALANHPGGGGARYVPMAWVEGVGVNDHSNGPRDFEPLGGNNFIVAVLPGMTLHLVDIWKPDRSPLLFAGSIFTRQGPVALTAAEMPLLENLMGRLMPSKCAC